MDGPGAGVIKNFEAALNARKAGSCSSPTGRCVAGRQDGAVLDELMREDVRRCTTHR